MHANGRGSLLHQRTNTCTLLCMGTDAIDAAMAEVAEVCGIINAAEARLVTLIAKVLDEDLWAGHGILSPEHWVAWQCGVSAGRARQLVAVARRRDELPTHAAL